MVTLDMARAAKPSALRQFQRLGNVVGVGITRIRDEYAVKVNLSEPLGPGVKTPTHVDGVPVRVEVTGELTLRT
ncbi:MAG: hypothetical protein LC667_03395 [Thioalkalivibrio sp.]|nr:hypothetical protein [Thioalkalivibrio sp.]